jgi:hypothetical protein
MALSTNTYIYAGGAQTFTVNFALGFIQRSDVQVRVNGAVDGSGDPAYTNFTWIDDSNITVTPTLTIGDSIQLLRTVSKTELKVDFSTSADVTPANLDLSAKHGLMVYQELVDGRVEGAESPIDAADRSAASADQAAISAAAALVSAGASSDSAQAAVVSETAADADATQVAADLVLTNADVVLTNADVVLTHADVVLTAADVVATNQDTIDTAADLVATNQDTIDTAADLALTNADVVLTHADVVLTAADAAQTALDRIATAADVVATADKIPTTEIGVSVQAYDATIVVDADIGSTVQAYDLDTAKTDVVQTYTASQIGEVTALTDAASVATDLALSNNYSLTLAGNRTLANPTNIVAGQSGSIFVTQDATGSRTLAYGSYFKFVGGTAPTLTYIANAIDRLDYVVKSATEIHAVVSLDVK